MKNFVKKFTVSFSILSVMLWSLGVNMALADKVDDSDEKGAVKILICHHEGESKTKTMEIEQSALAGHLVHGDAEGECPPDEDPELTVYSAWCSALLGIVQSSMDNNAVIDINGDGTLNLLDNMSPWYATGDDVACYGRFYLGENTYNFNQENYQNIDWCAGLKQGLIDSMGAAKGEARYSAIFDLHSDDVINLSDISVLAGYGDNQASCYAHYNFPTWPNAECGDGEINNEGEQCDDGNLVNGDGCSDQCIEEPTPPSTSRSQWCSALLGIFQSPMDNNAVINLNGGDTNLSDISVMSTWYADHNDTACYGRFDLGENTYNFNQDNYQNIDWCAGLKQGVTDFYGTSTTSPEFSTIFDLDHDGSIDLSDTPVLAGLLEAGDQTACYAYYNFPDWSDEPQECKTIAHATAYSENCEASACESGYTLSNGICNANGGSFSSNSGGGGGGVAQINFFNIQVQAGIASANISWETTRNSLTWLLYGTSSPAYGEELKNTLYNATHAVTLNNLLPNTTYHYQLRAQDSNGYSAYDADRTFVTNANGVPQQILGIKEVACVPDVDSDLKDIAQFNDGVLLRGCGPEVYHIVDGKKFHIPSWQYLHDHYLGLRIYNITDENLAKFSNISKDNLNLKSLLNKVLGHKTYADGSLLRGPDKKVYVIINGAKVHLQTLTDLKKYSGRKIHDVTEEVLNQY